MKSATPRWSCQLVRISSAMFSKAGMPGTMASRHVAHCAACREYYAAAASLDAALRRDAIQAQSAPPELHQGIMQAVARSAVAPKPRRRQRKPTVWLVALGACAAFAFVLISTPGISPSFAPPTATASASPLAEDDTPAWSTVIAPVNAVLNEEPLQSEADRVYADARSAVRFLALNFLPSTVASAPNGPAQVRQGPSRADG